MVRRTASCRCGQLTATCEGEPVRTSVCHCLECQKRTGSAFAAQARWPEDRVVISGEASVWQRTADSGHVATYRFCPRCGSTVAYVVEGWRGVVAILSAPSPIPASRRRGSPSTSTADTPGPPC